ncbi:MAG: hypothetical protein GWO02_13745 [Gammaproteobacteria bacterium]|nr:hypothetical protein [Gammaproteobacteria bacterium]
MSDIPDYMETELDVVREALRGRYGEVPEIRLADADLRLDPDSTDLTPCPTVYWEKDECHFVVFKTGEGRYRCQFFYGVNEQYGTGVHEYNDLSECVVTLLRVQADHALDRQRARS